MTNPKVLSMKRLFSLCTLFFILSLALFMVAREFIYDDIWHDAVVLISGLLLGVFCFWFSVLSKRLEGREHKRVEEKINRKNLGGA